MTEFVFNPDDPLARCDGESAKANRALYDYAMMGFKRSLAKLHMLYRQQTDPPTRRKPTLDKWSGHYAWQARVAAWEQLRAIEDHDKWAQRHAQLREDEWQVGSELLELSKAILAEGPRFIKTSTRVDRSGKEIMTVALNGKFLVDAMELASKLRRLAAGIETGGRLTTLNIDLSLLSDEQLARIANGEDPLHVLASAGQSVGGAGAQETPGD